MLTTPLAVRGPLWFHVHLGWDRYFAWLHLRQRQEIAVHGSLYSQQQKVFSVRGQLAPLNENPLLSSFLCSLSSLPL